MEVSYFVILYFGTKNLSVIRRCPLMDVSLHSCWFSLLSLK